MESKPITNLIRAALIEYDKRSDARGAVEKGLEVSKEVANKLILSFLYFPSEDTLRSVMETGKLPNEK